MQRLFTPSANLLQIYLGSSDTWSLGRNPDAEDTARQSNCHKTDIAHVLFVYRECNWHAVDNVEEGYPCNRGCVDDTSAPSKTELQLR